MAVGSAAVDQPGLIPEAAKRVGSQSVVVVIDVKRSGCCGALKSSPDNGTRGTGLDAVEFARRAESAGAGEIVVNSIDRDGEMKGYDLELARRIRDAVGVPLTVLGGAGSLVDIGDPDP